MSRFFGDVEENKEFKDTNLGDIFIAGGVFTGLHFSCCGPGVFMGVHGVLLGVGFANDTVDGRNPAPPGMFKPL